MKTEPYSEAHIPYHMLDLPCWDSTYGPLVDGNELVKYNVCCGEDAVRVQKGVEKVNRQETQVSQPLQ